uniref:Uncharacterized protein n=1 Tax=Anguilla anguilla TaxID=7936 RepID=A0A0E9RDU0_ANGAN
MWKSFAHFVRIYSRPIGLSLSIFPRPYYLLIHEK